MGKTRWKGPGRDELLILGASKEESQDTLNSARKKDEGQG
jgi:hypothetical protein